MNTENIEMLLERLVTVNEEISEKLDDVKYELGAIKEELNWVGEHTYAKVVYNGLNEITEKLHTELGAIKEELNWVGEHTYAKVVYDGLNEITEKLHAVEMGIIGIEANTTSA